MSRMVLKIIAKIQDPNLDYSQVSRSKLDLSYLFHQFRELHAVSSALRDLFKGVRLLQKQCE